MRAEATRLIEAICDHLAAAATAFGRPDPARTPFATPSVGEGMGMLGPTQLHLPPFAAMALHHAGTALGRDDYLAAADRYLLYMLAVLRDPAGGERDHYRELFAETVRADGGELEENRGVHLLSRSWQLGIALDAICRGFLPARDGETSLLGKAAALYDWLAAFRTERGPCYRIGYTPSGLTGRSIDGAFTDDLGLVARGLASYYDVTRRAEVLEDLVGLAGYFLRPHRPDSDDGAFSEELGTWVICPWPLTIEAEHVEGAARADRLGWAFSTREAVDFLTRLHAWSEDESFREQIRARTVTGMKWAFDACGFDDGGVGMMGRDDAFAGTTAAAIANYLDCRRAGLLTSAESEQYGSRARRSLEWILAWPADRIVADAGHRKVNGGVGLKPAENLGWLLAWAVETLLRSHELEN